MFYRDYLSNKALRVSLRNKLEKQQRKTNSLITIRDLVIYPKTPSQSYGESQKLTHINKTQNAFSRLTNHIHVLTNLANLYHEAAYCEQHDPSQLKKDSLNAITRLSLNEFSLYGETPLTLIEYGQLIANIEQLAKEIHGNVHLLLSSLAVINEKGKMLNVTLYVQGGENAKIDVLCKGVSSSIDINYHQPGLLFTPLVLQEPTSFVADEQNGCPVITNHSLFEFETIGGAKYTQAIDVCLDHLNNHSLKLLTMKLACEEIDTAHFLPEQADHIVTSNSIHVSSNAKITESILHIDPRPSKFFDNENINRPVENNISLSDQAIATLKNQCPNMQISRTSSGLSIVKPAFGPNYYLVAYQERPLTGYIADIKARVIAINNKIMNHRLDDIITTRTNSKYNDVETFQRIPEFNHNAIESAALLLTQLSEQCKFTSSEALFKTKNYLLKKQAILIIEAAHPVMQRLSHDENNTFVYYSIEWSKNIKQRLGMLDKKHSPQFVNTMVKLIEDFQLKIAITLPEALPIEPKAASCN